MGKSDFRLDSKIWQNLWFDVTEDAIGFEVWNRPIYDATAYLELWKLGWENSSIYLKFGDKETRRIQSTENDCGFVRLIAPIVKDY